MLPDVVGHPGIFGILHLTYYVLGHIKSFYGILNSMLVWVLEHTVGLCAPFCLAQFILSVLVSVPAVSSL